jgi:hypothetical protein
MEESKMRLRLLLCGPLLVAAPLTATAQSLCQNTCTGMVDSPFQGREVTSPLNQPDGVLWPPNHKLRTVRIYAENQDGDACDVTIADVRQDEPITGAGSGNQKPDAASCSNAGNTSSVSLRGERAGTGTGRYYHVSYTMEDPDCAAPKSDEARILVPHDQGVAHIDTWVDEGPVFASHEDGVAIRCPE